MDRKERVDSVNCSTSGVDAMRSWRLRVADCSLARYLDPLSVREKHESEGCVLGRAPVCIRGVVVIGRGEGLTLNVNARTQDCYCRSGRRYSDEYGGSTREWS